MNYTQYKKNSGAFPTQSMVTTPTGNPPQTPAPPATATLLQSSSPMTNRPIKEDIELVTKSPMIENMPVLEGSPRSSRSSLSRGSSRMTETSGNERLRDRRRKMSGGSGVRRGSRGNGNGMTQGMNTMEPQPISTVGSNIPQNQLQPQQPGSPTEYDGVYYTGEPIPGRPANIEFRDETLEAGLPRRQDSTSSTDNRSFVSSTIAV